MKKNIIIRNTYIKKIEPFIGDSLIKVIVGQRRVGKSFILLQLMEILKENYDYQNIIYINKEDYSFDSIRNYSDLIGYVESKNIKNGNAAIFVDEIQEIEGFEKALRHFQQKGIYDIYCSGSNAQLLSGEIASLLSGRYIQIRIFSLSYREFLEFHDFTDSNDSFLKYIQYGGMPHLINLKENPSVYSEYHRNIFDSIVLRDIIERYRIRNVRLIQDLIAFLSENIGSVVSAKKISEYLKSQKINTPVKTILNYLNYLESVYLINRVKRAEIGGEKIFEIGEKFYFENLGLRNIVVPSTQKDIGKVLENIVYNNLRVLDYSVNIGKLEDKEIDFVAQKNNQKIYIQDRKSVV